MKKPEAQKGIKAIETLFFNDQIIPLIEKLKSSDSFKVDNFLEIANSPEIITLDSLLTSDTATVENILCHGIGEVLIKELFPHGVEYFFETRWNHKGKVVEIAEKSPINGLVKDYQLLNPLNNNYEKFENFRMGENATLLSSINILRPVKKNNSIVELRIGLKSPGSLAFKITQLLYGHSDKEIYDRVRCKLICADSRDYSKCYDVLQAVKDGIKHPLSKNEVGNINVYEPYSKNIEDAIRNPRKGKEKLKIIFVNALYSTEKLKKEGYSFPGRRVNFRMHIEPISALKFEKNEGSDVSHTSYKQKAWEEAQKTWTPEAWGFYNMMKETLDIRYVD